MRNLIFGTDWYTDCDDVVALRILLRAHRDRKINLLGIGINACCEDSVAAVDGFLHLEGIGTDLPIGIDHSAFLPGSEHRYQSRMAKHAKRFYANEEVPDGVRFYRSLLANADGTVEIAEVGFLQILAGLLQSQGDDISPKSGMELVKEKVKCIWSMGGKWDTVPGWEYNFAGTPFAREAIRFLLENCPVPMIFLGFEVGEPVLTGGELVEEDPVHLALVDHGCPEGRCSWDPMLAYLAVVGDPTAAGYDIRYGKASFDVATGHNFFVPSENGPHAYVIKRHPDAYYAKQINDIIG